MEKISADYFDRLWFESEPKDGMQHTKETWDRLAVSLAKDPPELEALKQRHCADLADYLADRGILTADSHVLDIGCGTGMFDMAFAKAAKHVTCSDISPMMLHYCKETAEQLGLTNMDYVDCDFLTFDTEAAGWTKQFDLVFASLTPAITGLKSLEKMNAISRRWCVNNSFIYRKDNLREAVAANVFGKPAMCRKSGHSTYCLFNILWQLGYTPEIRYYKEELIQEYDLTSELAQSITATIIRDYAPTDEEIRKTYDYLGKYFAVDGKITKKRESLFAWTLWNVGD